MREAVNLPQEHQAAYLDPALIAFAEFVQQLPASEAHHHAGLGGMLDHTLEVATKALLIRRGHVVPQGVEPEAVAKLADLWTYAVFTAALLHDVGKPAIDQEVRILDRAGREIGLWNPWKGPMTKAPGGHCYGLRFARDRRHKLHERVAPILARDIIPSEGLCWLASNREVFDQWSAAIMGDMDHAGVLGQIINQADRESVAQNLGAGDSVRLAPRTKPLHEKLIVALRHLLNQGDLPLNRNGAAGWLLGEDLWLVSKRTADALRGHLQAEGHSGIPSSNDRVFDALQENGVLMPNEDRAIWKAEIAGNGWANTLTLLRLQASRVWTDTESRPNDFEGKVTPEASPPKNTNSSETYTGATQSLDQAKQPQNRDADELTAEHPESRPGKATETTGGLPLPPGIEGILNAVKDDCPSMEAVAQIPVEPEPISRTAPKAQPTQQTGDDSMSDDAGKAFLQWIQGKAQSGSLPLNTTGARVHVVTEGVLLVSPVVFRDFAKHHEDYGDWTHVQKRFQKLYIHDKTTAGTNIHTYRVAGERQASTIKGILIRDVKLIFGTVSPPQPNPHLTHLLTPE